MGRCIRTLPGWNTLTRRRPAQARYTGPQHCRGRKRVGKGVSHDVAGRGAWTAGGKRGDVVVSSHPNSSCHTRLHERHVLVGAVQFVFRRCSYRVDPAATRDCVRGRSSIRGGKEKNHFFFSILRPRHPVIFQVNTFVPKPNPRCSKEENEHGWGMGSSPASVEVTESADGYLVVAVVSGGRTTKTFRFFPPSGFIDFLAGRCPSPPAELRRRAP